MAARIDAGVRLHSPELDFAAAGLGMLLHPDSLTPAPPALDLERLLIVLRQHRLVGLFHELGKRRPELWPPEFQARLKLERIQLAAAGERSRAKTVALLQALALRGLQPVLLKGWSLTETLYGGDASLRPTGDVDLLFAYDEAPAAIDFMLAQGSLPDNIEPAADYNRRFGIELAFFPPRTVSGALTGTVVEIHWRLLAYTYYSSQMDIRGILDRSQPLIGWPARSLAPEENLPYLCAHAALHHERDQRLFRLYDIALLLQIPGLDLDAIFTNVQSWRLAVPFCRILAEIERTWPGTIPSAWTARLRALHPTRPETLMFRLIQTAQSSRWLGYWLNLFSLPEGRADYLLQMAFPQRSYFEARFGPPPMGRPGLYHLVRIGSLGKWLRYPVVERVTPPGEANL
jgi:hypothetical protein